MPSDKGWRETLPSPLNCLEAFWYLSGTMVASGADPEKTERERERKGEHVICGRAERKGKGVYMYVCGCEMLILVENSHHEQAHNGQETGKSEDR